MKKISVITINYNDTVGLKRTIDSVAMQVNHNFEFIIIDGGSTDGSVDVIKQNESIITYWCSEKDKGIYDAQNKGIAKATGEYLVFMNSGDTFYDKNVFGKFIEIQSANDKAIIYGNVNTIKGHIQTLEMQNEQLTPYFWYKKTLNHQAAFIKRTLFTGFGLYNIEYRISADFDFFLKVWLKMPQEYFYYNFTICNFYLDGLSQQKENFDILVEEREVIYLRLFPDKLHKKLRKQFRRTLPFKSRVLDYIYARPFLNAIFQKLYKVYAKVNPPSS
ncbi:MAG: glycosyltransferase family 2 protein [Bacteroidota bacterium]